jgi:hypothetical protein
MPQGAHGGCRYNPGMIHPEVPAPVIGDQQAAPSRVEGVDGASPARREAFDHVVWSGFLVAGFLGGALIQFEAIGWHLLLAGVAAAPFALWQPIRDGWRRIPRGEPPVLAEDVELGPRWSWRALSRLRPNVRRWCHRFLWCAWMGLALGFGYGIAWLSDRLGSDLPGAVIVTGSMAGSILVFVRVRRWERRHARELIWALDDEGETIPCVRETPTLRR